jgi:peptidyl-prolyl cis-trans isomerase B (cyclophilin B)
VGTAKRERKKMNRHMGREAEMRAVKRKKMTKKTVRIVLVVAVLVAGFFAIALSTKDDDSTPETTGPVETTTPTDTSTPVDTTAPGDTTPVDSTAPSAFAYGTTECAPLEGAMTQTQEFADAFALCIDPSKTYTATVVTNMGEYTAILDPVKAPGTVNNFVNLARHQDFDGTICHRAIPGLMVQCGDPTATGTGGPGYKFADELPSAGEYKIGSLVMANSGPDSNGSQFFVITGSQGVGLDPNYALFGQVTDGLDTTVVALDAAGNPDKNANGSPPLKEIKIESITISES